MAMLNKQQILQANDLKRELVHVEEWGGDVYVRALTAGEKDRHEAEWLGEQDIEKKARIYASRSRLLARTLVDESGNRLFTDNEMEILEAKASVPMQRLYEVAQRLNAFTEAAVEGLVKNSEPSQVEDLPSA
jgi:hypothetical protein